MLGKLSSILKIVTKVIEAREMMVLFFENFIQTFNDTISYQLRGSRKIRVFAPFIRAVLFKIICWFSHSRKV